MAEALIDGELAKKIGENAKPEDEKKDEDKKEDNSYDQEEGEAEKLFDSAGAEKVALVEDETQTFDNCPAFTELDFSQHEFEKIPNTIVVKFITDNIKKKECSN